MIRSLASLLPKSGRRLCSTAYDDKGALITIGTPTPIDSISGLNQMTHDIRNELSIEEHSARCAAPVVNPNAPIQIRFMRVDEATALARCVYRSYGDSYDADCREYF